MNIIQAAIENLWYWTYGILVGWGASFTILIGLIIFLFVQNLRLRQRMTMLENRIVANYREFSLFVDKDGLRK